MQDFSTTQRSADPVARCPSNCKEAMALVMQDVNRITRIPGALDRNAAITAAYRDLGKAMPNNHWVRLAGYVSTQGGCAMKSVQDGIVGSALFPPAAYFTGEGLVDSMKALVDANTTIFSSVYPPNAFMHKCGYRKLKECVDSGEIDVNPKLMAALKKMNDGDLKGAADAIAEHEQVDVVQPVYERNKAAFDFMKKAEGWMPGDQTSIPVAYSCTRDNLVSLGTLKIQNPLDRVTYYGRLMDRMKEIEGIR